MHKYLLFCFLGLVFLSGEIIHAQLLFDPFIGKPGPGSHDFSVNALKESGTIKHGDHLSFSVETRTGGHLIIVGLSSEGDPTLILPNAKMPDSYVAANDKKTLFDSNSPVQLIVGDFPPKAKLMFYMSTAKPEFGNQEVEQGIWIKPDKDEDVAIQKISDELKRLNGASELTWFLITIPGEDKAYAEGQPRMMSPKPQAPAVSGKPGPSKPPDSLSGVQGISEPLAVK